MSESPAVALVAMRLADMTRMHPRQDDSRVCSECGHQVGIYPTGQNVIRANPGIKIICARCATVDFRSDDINMPAGSIDEIIQESRDSFDVGKA